MPPKPQAIQETAHWTNRLDPSAKAAFEHYGTIDQSQVKILSAVQKACSFNSMVDVGTGRGSWVVAAMKLGLSDVRGYDIPVVKLEERNLPPEKFVEADLSVPLNPERKFDVAVSTEVAEHLQAKHAQTFVGNICALSDLVIFSAAIPYQGGIGHVNENWVEYWAHIFFKNGYSCFDFVRQLLWHDTSIRSYYRQNVMVFAKNNPKRRLEKNGLKPTATPMSFIHPEQYIKVANRAKDQKLRSIEEDVRNYYFGVDGQDNTKKKNDAALNFYGAFGKRKQKFPKISCVMPCYNAEDFLDEAVQSIVDQDFKDWELIAVNDGSTDSTGLKLRDWVDRDSRIMMIDQPNMGISVALNRAIERARGAYIARMDADDISLPNRFGRQVEFMKNHPDTVIVGSSYIEIDQSGNSHGITRFGNFPNTLFPFGTTPHLPWLCHPSVLMRREALLAAGQYDPAHDKAEDLDLWFKLHRLGKFASLKEPLIKFRTIHDARSSTQGLSKQTMPTALVIDKYQKEFLAPIIQEIPNHYELMLFTPDERSAFYMLRRSAFRQVVKGGYTIPKEKLADIAGRLKVLMDKQPIVQNGKVSVASPLRRMIKKLVKSEKKHAGKSFWTSALRQNSSLAAADPKHLFNHAKSEIEKLMSRFVTMESYRKSAARKINYPAQQPPAPALDDLAFSSSFQKNQMDSIQQTFHLLPNLRLMFAECSKNGCTSLKAHLGFLELGTNLGLQKKFLATSFHWKRRSPFLGRDDIGQSNFTGFLLDKANYKFAMSRNPYARLFSAYNDKIAGLMYQRQNSFNEYAKVCKQIAEFLGKSFDPKTLNKDIEVPISFEEFVAFVSNNRDKANDRHWHPQWKTMRPDIIKFDQIGKIENFDQEFVKLMLNLGIHEKYWHYALLHKNRKDKSSKKWTEAYTAGIADTVFEIYKQDFEYFGYARDSWIKQTDEQLEPD